MISHIMINQLYHIVSITDNRKKKLSYHLEIWYLDSENYHIISKLIIRFSKFIISYRNWYLSLESYHIISKMIFRFFKLSYHIKSDILIFKFIFLYWELYWSFKQENYLYQNKTSKFFKIMAFLGKESFDFNQCHPISWIFRKTSNLSYRIVNDNYSLKNIISYHWW